MKGPCDAESYLRWVYQDLCSADGGGSQSPIALYIYPVFVPPRVLLSRYVSKPRFHCCPSFPNQAVLDLLLCVCVAWQATGTLTAQTRSFDDIKRRNALPKTMFIVTRLVLLHATWHWRVGWPPSCHWNTTAVKMHISSHLLLPVIRETVGDYPIHNRRTERWSRRAVAPICDFPEIQWSALISLPKMDSHFIPAPTSTIEQDSNPQVPTGPQLIGLLCKYDIQLILLSEATCSAEGCRDYCRGLHTNDPCYYWNTRLRSSLSFTKSRLRSNLLRCSVIDLIQWVLSWGCTRAHVAAVVNMLLNDTYIMQKVATSVQKSTSDLTVKKWSI